MMLCKVALLCGITFASLRIGNSRSTASENHNTAPNNIGSRNKRVLYAPPCNCDKDGNGFCIKNETTKDIECRCKPGYGVYKSGMFGDLICKECKCGRLMEKKGQGRKFDCTIEKGIFADVIKCNCDAEGYVDTGKTCEACNCGEKYDGMLFNCSSPGKCICPQGYKLVKSECEPNDVCRLSPCKNGGSCENTKSSVGFVCKCTEGFGGNFCERFACDCDKDGNGFCIKNEATKDIECRCKPGYGVYNRTGLLRMLKCKECKCGQNGQGRKFSCTIHAGFFADTIKCNCDTEGYVEAGQICKEINPCDANPCKNGGTCNKRTHKDFTCICPPTHNGTTRENEINPCDANPCKNGGTCNKRTHKDFTCICPPTHNGTTCENVVTVPDETTTKDITTSGTLPSTTEPAITESPPPIREFRVIKFKETEYDETTFKLGQKNNLLKYFKLIRSEVEFASLLHQNSSEVHF